MVYLGIPPFKIFKETPISTSFDTLKFEHFCWTKSGTNLIVFSEYVYVSIQKAIPFLPETNSKSPWKSILWKMNFLFWEFANCQVLCHVSFRNGIVSEIVECIVLVQEFVFACHPHPVSARRISAWLIGLKPPVDLTQSCLLRRLSPAATRGCAGKRRGQTSEWYQNSDHLRSMHGICTILPTNQVRPLKIGQSPKL